jgi:cytochrome d ubiquinol oxidase subunit II
MELTTIWFGLITILWVGYLVLEGFDFGVGVLLPVIGHNERERRTVLRSIGPLWDGNEVWLLVAGGATFAAFPLWYATLFSGFYLALFLILVALIVRNVGIEFRNKRPEPSWRARWDAAISIASLAAALLWGVALANIVAGVPIDASHHYTGDLLTLLNPYALLAGLTTLGLFATHGALFLALKTDGELRQRANRLAGRVGLVAAVLAVLFLGWTQAANGDPGSLVLSIVAVVAFVGALAANRLRRELLAFGASALTIALAVVALFVVLFPDVLPSTTNAAYSLTTTNASSTEYTLGIMTVVAVIFTPLVLLYQGWTYWIFRRRLTTPLADEAAAGTAAAGEAN